eukprot:196096_1
MKHFWQRKEPLLPITNPIVNTRKDSEPSICAQPIKFCVLFSFICLVVVLFAVCMKMDFSLLGYSGEPERNAALYKPEPIPNADDVAVHIGVPELNTAPGVLSPINVPDSSTGLDLIGDDQTPSTAPGPKQISAFPQVEPANVSETSTLNASVTPDGPEPGADQRNAALYK